MNPRLFFAALVHCIFSQYGDIMSGTLNLMNVPLKKLFNESMQHHYGMTSNDSFEMFFSVSSSSMFVGLMIGFAVMGYLMDKVGRKQTAVYIRGSLALAGCTCMILAKVTGRCEFYVLGHITAGIVTGLKVVVIIYVAECCPDRSRGLISMALNSGAVAVVMLATPLCLPTILGNDSRWTALPMICMSLAVIHITLASRFPQSPKQLYIQYHRVEEARESLEYYFDNKEDIESKIIDMDWEIKNHSGRKASLMHILRHSRDRQALFLVLLCAFVPVFSAINVKIPYLLSMLISYGMDQAQATTAMTLINAGSLPVCFIAPYLIRRFGRKPLFVVIAILCAIEWVWLGSAQSFLDLHSTNMTWSWICACIGALVGQSAVNLGLLIMSPILISEICPHHTRAAISQFTQVLPIALAVAEVALFPMLRSTVGSSLFFFRAIGCSILAVALFFMMGEETPRRESLLGVSPEMLRQLVSRPPSYGSLESSDSQENLLA